MEMLQKQIVLSVEKLQNIKLFHAAVENNEEFPSCLKCGFLVKVATISFDNHLI